MTDTLTWASVRAPHDESTQAALDELERVGEQYERYIRLAGINELPMITELGDLQHEAPSSDNPLGFVIDVTTPMGFQLTKRA